ncbi:DsrE/DsrF-like family protein [Caballeronia arvi]|uniref:DsrE/DsrF-like family protein n=1 Tax=Caballeronia arvi TaxID=1777135 RepID=A0A158L3L6_9BURK|nr:DsrE family protein [Caballeronia arvi]SAL87974.1 DsrE/DsrF-like family protein [Caballeronia arvi]
MKILKGFAAATLVGAMAMSAATLAQEKAPDGYWLTPTIANYGRVHLLPDAAFMPQPDRTYKIVFSLTQAAKTPDVVDPGLDRVARTVNLYVAAGVPLSRLNFVAVASGPATALVLDDEHYRAAYGVANPNLPLIAALKKAGVTVAVCGQAVAERHFDFAWVAPDVILALSALTTVTTLETQGYVLMPL